MPDTVETTEPGVVGELLGVNERVVVAPCEGRFSPLPPEIFTCEGEWVEPGQPVATILTGTDSVEVRSPFRGWMMGTVALAGQPVHRGEALFWLWGC